MLRWITSEESRAADGVKRRRAAYDPREVYRTDGEIRRAIEFIERDFFSMMEPRVFAPLIHALLSHGDHYMLLAGLRDYIQTQERVDAAYQDRDGWVTKSIINVARAGKFVRPHAPRVCTVA